MKKTFLLAGALLGLTLMLVSCADQVAELTAPTHPADWADPNSPTFHGKFVLEGAETQPNCTSCHGTDYRGGASKVSCMSSGCHAAYPHPENFTNTQSDDFHGKFIAEQGLWDLSACRSCHGDNYAGKGVASKNCLSCHNQRDGPENCTTCHGSDNGIGPPLDLLGRSSPTIRSVGAHTAHTTTLRFTSALASECTQCHIVPRTFDAPGHFDNGPAQAEVVFSARSTQNGKLATTWDPVSTTCSNVYCHGGFVFEKSESENAYMYIEPTIRGNNVLLNWTDGIVGQVQCGTCHDLPPKGHGPATTCNGCHTRVVDANLNIIDKGLHINGKVDLF